MLTGVARVHGCVTDHAREWHAAAQFGVTTRARAGGTVLSPRAEQSLRPECKNASASGVPIQPPKLPETRSVSGITTEAFEVGMMASPLNRAPKIGAPKAGALRISTGHRASGGCPMHPGRGATRRPPPPGPR